MKILSAYPTVATLPLLRPRGLPGAIPTRAPWRVRLSWFVLLYGGSLSSGMLAVNVVRWLLTLP